MIPYDSMDDQQKAIFLMNYIEHTKKCKCEICTKQAEELERDLELLGRQGASSASVQPERLSKEKSICVTSRK